MLAAIEALIGNLTESLPSWLSIALLFLVGNFVWNWRLLRPEALKVVDEPIDPAIGPTNAQKIKLSLQKSDFGTEYRRRVRGALMWTGRKLPPVSPPQRKPHGLGGEIDYAFSNNAFGFFLLAALAYPLMLMFAEFAFFGGEGRIGDLQVFNPETPAWRRVMGFVVVICLYPANYFGGKFVFRKPKSLARRTKSKRFESKESVDEYSLRGWPAAVGSAATRNHASTRYYTNYHYPSGYFLVYGSGVVGIAVADLGVTPVSLAVFVAGTLAFPRAAGFAVAGAWATFLAFGLTLGHMIIIARAGDVTLLLAIGVASFFAMVVSVMIMVVTPEFHTQEMTVVRKFRRDVRRGAFPLLIMTSFSALIMTAFHSKIETAASTPFFFLVVLPLCNGAFDFLSFGVTRLLLWQATREPKASESPVRTTARILAYASADLVIAAMFLVGLAFSIISLMHAFNLAAMAGPAGAPIFDIADKLNALRSADDRPEWVYVMHFSTFLPSLVHLILMLLSLPTRLLPVTPNAYFAQRITPALALNDRMRVLIAAWQSVRVTCSAGVVFFLFVSFVIFGAGATDSDGVRRNLGYVGELFIGLAEAYARWIGAI